MIIYKNAETDEARNEVYRLRFRVACRERLLEPEEAYPSGLIQDEYDQHAIQAMARHFDLIPLGTLRLVHRNPAGLPVQKNCGITIPAPAGSGELSRLAISGAAIAVSGARRREILTGLLRILCLEGAKMGITCWYMVLSDSMYRLATLSGIRLFPVRGARPCPEGMPYLTTASHLGRLLFPHDVPQVPSRRTRNPSSPKADRHPPVIPY